MKLDPQSPFRQITGRSGEARLSFFFLLVFCPVFASLPEDPLVLQKRAIQRVEQYVLHFRQTGERESLLPELLNAERELQESYDGFLAKKDLAGAAMSQITRGHIENIRSVQPLGEKTGSSAMITNPEEFMRKHRDSAFVFYSEAADLAKRAKNPACQAKALIGMAKTDGLDRGNLSAGMSYIGEAIRLASEAANKDYLFEAFDIAAELEMKRGDQVAAGKDLDQAFALSGEVVDKSQLYFGYVDRADMYKALGEKCVYQTQFELCRQELKLARADYEQARAVCNRLGYAFLAQTIGSFTKELDFTQTRLDSQERQTRMLATSLFHPQKASDVLVTQHFEPGANPQALAMIQTVLQQYPGLFQGSSPTGLYTEGMLHAMEGNRDAALISYRKSVELLEQDRRKLRDDESRGTFLEDKIEYYYAPALLLMDMQRFGEAFELLERSRSRSMADLLASSPLTLRTPLERGLFSESMRLKAEIALQQKKLFAMTAGADRAKHASEIQGIEGQIGTLEGQLQRVQTRIATEAPKLGELTVSQPVSLESAQSSASREHYDLLYYLVQETAVVIWDINEAGVKVFNVFLPRSEVTAKVAALRNSLIEHEKNRDAKFDEQTSRELFLFLIQPVLKSIKTNHLVIVPHENLNNLPYQVLQDPSTGAYLGERFQVSYAMSATVLTSLEKKPNLAGGKLLAVAGADIVDASNEVEAIGRLYPNRSKLVKDVPVNKEQIKSWVAGYDLVHLSMHGVFNGQDPLLSYLKLSPTSADNGRLTAAEMFGLPLTKGSLVVLSACQTGQVEATHSNEVLGMVRALLYAGANNLVLSSWEVESKATELWMVTFYREAQTNPPSEAARLALVAVKGRPEYRDPYYWGPFLLTGK